MNRIVLWILIFSVVVAPATATPKTREVADEDVDRAIGELKRYLYAQQKPDGGWGSWHPEFDADGDTAIAVFALLEAGESPDDPRMKKGLAALVAVKPRRRQAYVIATRIMALSLIVAQKKNSPYRDQLVRDVAWLTKNARRMQGAWGYRGADTNGDNSVSQFALLALWEADRAGVKVDSTLIRLAERTWIRRQRRNGGWTYAGQANLVEAKTTTSMTAAGLASLYLCQDVLSNRSGPYPTQRNAEKAWRYLAKNLKPDFHKDEYLAFCIQRVGLSSGRKYIADMNWYALGAAEYAKPVPSGRRFRSKWGPWVRAAFELIFLARGRLPLTFNKLQHGKEAVWNWHNRDIANFSEYMRRWYERRMRWQIVKIADDVRELLDAPIMLVSGTKALTFSKDQWNKLREYTLRGGVLLFVPTNNNRPFINSAKEALEDLYAEQRELAGGYYTLKKLPSDHPLYSASGERIRNGEKVLPMYGVSDGTRLLAVVCERDISATWQRKRYSSGGVDFRLGVNFLFYATGANALQSRMRPVFIGKDRAAKYSAKVAWVRHGGNWSTQPYALNYLAQKLRAENRVSLDVTVGAALTADALAGHKLAWMSGSDKFVLKENQLDALEKYLDGGGTLFVNAVGGSREFRRSAELMLERLFEGKDVFRGGASSNSPLMTGKCGKFRGPIIGDLKRTKAWVKVSPEAGSPLIAYQYAGRIMAIYAPNGIHDTLDGHTAHGAKSYMPKSARDIAANVVLYAMMDKPKPKPKKPATEPSTQPSTQPAPTTTPTTTKPNG